MKNEQLEKNYRRLPKTLVWKKFGQVLTFLCLSLIVFIVAMILIFVAQRGLSTFFVDGVNITDFLFGDKWEPNSKTLVPYP